MKGGSLYMAGAETVRKIDENASVQYVRGVGAQRAALYAKLGISTVGGLLRHYPRDYINLSGDLSVAAAAVGEKCAVRAFIVKKSREQRIRAKLSLSKVVVSDGENDIVVTFFNMKYTVDDLVPGEEYIFYGTVSGSVLRKEMNSPLVIKPDREGGFAKYIPLYSLTAGLSSKMIAANVNNALELMSENWRDPLPAEIRVNAGLCGSEFALRNIHQPGNESALTAARERLVFDEIFTVTLGMAMERSKNRMRAGAVIRDGDISGFGRLLPFTLTGAQQRTLGEIAEDMTRSYPMNRLVQGDVGSGKTAVAAGAIWLAHKNGYQSVLMAPTELLAEQHFKTLSILLKESDITMELLTGSVSAKEKRQIKENISSGKTQLLIGTHAVIEKDVAFERLGLVVTDEQHRFGVHQRFALASKGEAPHLLTMSATPIPRTLASALYGELEVSVIDELPKGRIPIKTYLIDSAIRERAYGFVKKHLDEGYQGYIVCPLVEKNEESGDPGMISAVEYAEELKNGTFSAYSVGLLHGKMKPADKEHIMREFAAGNVQLLVATTVIEVGIDVPNSVIMLIENAERFGLSQLHQLRGRVGRGAVQSYCVLISDAKGETAQKRLKTIAKETDGLKIAQADLALRGPGDFFGSRQHGEADGRIIEMLENERLSELARTTAEQLLREDPELCMEKHAVLRERAQKVVELVNC
ncbi:MAG: ATP-dependent DNA helicase RecG [Ruminococcaceae bacterium]|nr:ATP-dependent DNA helicase RecG [Oscillospiraceae bacterium]